MLCSVVPIGSWIKTFFIDKADLFLKVLDDVWNRAPQEVESIVKLFEKYGIDRKSRILEVGCGNGRILINLALRGFENLVGIDISPKFLEDGLKRARKFGVDDRIEFIAVDAHRLSKALARYRFKAILFVWSTLIGYYGDPNKDLELFRICREIAEDNGYLFILSTSNRDLAALRSSILPSAMFMSRIDEDLVLVEAPQFDPTTSTVRNCWTFYRARGKDLLFIDEICYEMRLYSLHELVDIAKKAGWRLVDFYGDLRTLSRYRPSFSTLNIVLQAQS